MLAQFKKVIIFFFEKKYFLFVFARQEQPKTTSYGAIAVLQLQYMEYPYAIGSVGDL
jgi:hypothetical protein